MTYDWDTRNRLIRVTFTDGGTETKRVEYDYNVANLRIEKRVSTDGGSSWNIERYALDGSDVVLTFDDSNTVEHTYFHGPAVDQIFADENAVGEILWALSDHQGTVRDWIDAADANTNASAPTQHVTYSAFGEILSATDLGRARGHPSFESNLVILQAPVKTGWCWVSFVWRFITWRARIGGMCWRMEKFRGFAASIGACGERISADRIRSPELTMSIVGSCDTERSPLIRPSATFSPGAQEKGLDDAVQVDRIEHGERAGWRAPISLISLEGFSVFGVQFSENCTGGIAREQGEVATSR